MLRKTVLAGVVGMAAASADAATIVHSSGNLQATIDAASPGDTIEVANGTWARPDNFGFLILKPLTVRCTNGLPSCTLSASPTNCGPVDAVVFINPQSASGVTLEGFVTTPGHCGNGVIVAATAPTNVVIRNMDVSPKATGTGAGFQNNGATNVVVEGCRVRQAATNGIFGSPGSNGMVIRNNTVDATTSQYPIGVQGSSTAVSNNVLVKDNTVTTLAANVAGILIDKVFDGVVTGNHVVRAPNGIFLVDGGRNILMSNTISRTDLAHGIVVKNSDFNHVVANTLRNINLTAISVVGSRNNVFERNDIANWPVSPGGSDGILIDVGTDQPEPNGRRSYGNIVCKNKLVSQGFLNGIQSRAAGTGIWLNKESDGTCVIGNRVSGNKEGGLTSFGSSFNYWIGNDVSQNGEAGVFLWDNFDHNTPLGVVYPTSSRTQRNWVHNNHVYDVETGAMVLSRGARTTDVGFNHFSATAFPPPDSTGGVQFEYSVQRGTATESPSIYGNTVVDINRVAYFESNTVGAQFFRNRAFNSPTTVVTSPAGVKFDAQAFIGGNYWFNQSPPAVANPSSTTPFVVSPGYVDRFPFKDPHFGLGYGLTVLSPRATTSVFPAGTAKTISWLSEGCNAVDISLVQGASTVATLASNYPDYGYYVWDVPALAPASNYQIVIACKGPGNSATGVSAASSSFTLANANLVLMSPGGGETLRGNPGATQSIRVAWKKAPSITSVNVQVSIDGGAFTTLASNVTADFADVSAPAASSSRVVFRLTSNDANASDSTDDFLALRNGSNGAVANVPAGTVLISGRKYDIEWTQPDNTSYQDLQIFDGTAGAYVTLAQDLPACTRRFRVLMPELWMLQGHFRLVFKDLNHSPIMTSPVGNSISVRYQTNAGVGVTMFRLYNPALATHLLTTDPNEYNVLATMGWTQEGRVGGLTNGPATVDGVETVPFYRLYRPAAYRHFWTSDRNEYFILRESGSFNAEHLMGYLFPSQVTGTKPMRRLSHKTLPLHVYSTDINEYNTLVASGVWNGEGILGYILN